MAVFLSKDERNVDVGGELIRQNESNVEVGNKLVRQEKSNVEDGCNLVRQEVSNVEDGYNLMRQDENLDVMSEEVLVENTLEKQIESDKVVPQSSIIKLVFVIKIKKKVKNLGLVDRKMRNSLVSQSSFIEELLSHIDKDIGDEVFDSSLLSERQRLSSHNIICNNLRLLKMGASTVVDL